jgi:hypothetical protein
VEKSKDYTKMIRGRRVGIDISKAGWRDKARN